MNESIRIEEVLLRIGILGFSLFLGAIPDAQAEDSREFRGRVVDEHSTPVAGADVAVHWSASGPIPPKDSDRKGSRLQHS